MTRRQIIVNWGLGADSTAWLLHLVDLLMDWRIGAISHGEAVYRAGLPADADLDRITVVTAMTGTEWEDSTTLGEQHVLPALRLAGLRLIQAARSGPYAKDPVTILDDSTSPTALHTEGDFRLIDEMLAGATIPTTGGNRICSQNSKALALEPVIAEVTAGQRYVQVMGFDASLHEQGRARADARFNTAQREGAYPLQVLDWARDRCLHEIYLRTGVAAYPKSACPMCPYGLTSAEGRARTLALYARYPRLALEPLLMEDAALACNVRMGLIGGESLWQLIAATRGLEHVTAAYETFRNAQTWRVVRVRRALKAKVVDKETGRRDLSRAGFSARSLRSLAGLSGGSRPGQVAALLRLADHAGLEPDLSDPRHPKLWVRHRSPFYPALEDLVTLVPHQANDKIARGFASTWRIVHDELDAAGLLLPEEGTIPHPEGDRRNRD